MTKTWILVASLGLAMAVPVQARQDKAADEKSADAKGKLAAADAKFTQHAWAFNMAQVKLGEMAENQGASDEVKACGKMMAEHHAKAQTDLEIILKDHGLDGAKDLDAKHKALLDKLGKLKDAAFDKGYIAAMVAGHAEALKKFAAEAKNGKDEGLKAYADKTQGTIKEHHGRALEIKKNLAAPK